MFVGLHSAHAENSYSFNEAGFISQRTMMNDHSVLDTEVNGSILGDKTNDVTDSTLSDNVDNCESPSVLESGEASFPAPEELRSSRTSRSNRSIWKSSLSPKNGATATKKSCRLYAVLVAVVVLVFIVIIPAVVVSNKNEKTEKASALNEDEDQDDDAANRPRPTFDEIVKYIVNEGVSTDTDILTSDTPQNKAAMWLMRDDPANVPVPTTFDISTYEGYRYMTRYIMAVNYFAFDGENWEVGLGWLTGADVCDWNRPVYINRSPAKLGLFCTNTGSTDEDGTVTIKRTPTAMSLVFQLDGSIPRENGMLTTLVTMQLAGNRGLSGRIPTELCALTNLQDLALQGNQLSGTIPSCLGNMKSLDVVLLAANELEGAVPLELCQLTALKELHLSFNSLNGTIPSCLGNLPLEVLDVGHNLLTGQVPNDFENLVDTMWAFSADDNMLSGDPSAIFNKLKALKHLSASINELTFTMNSTFLVDSPNLVRVDLSDNEIDGTFPSHLLTESYPNLYTLDVSKNKLMGKLSGEVQIESPIQFLGAHDNNLTGSLSSLVNLTKLRHVDLSNNQLTGSLEPIGEVPYISNIFLSENPFDISTFPESFGELRYLEELSLRNTNLMGNLPVAIGENWTYVELIDLGANNLEGSIPETFGNLSSLHYLLLYDNIGINGTIPDGFQNLEQLKGVLLDGTSIDSPDALDLFCQLPNFKNNVTGTELLVVNCDDECTQCFGCQCCNEVDSSGCSQPQLGNIDIMWTENFRRPGNEFNFSVDFNLST